MKKKISATLLLCLSCACSLYAQDPRERHYFYEILNPSHEEKPLVQGFAQTRIEEKLDRGLTAVPAQDGKSVYLSWRLLANDKTTTSFHVYRESNGKVKRITRKALTATCDYTDKTPSEQCVYWIESVNKGEKKVASEKVSIRLADLKPYTSIKLHNQEKAGKIALADLNGDGRYDYIIRTPETNVDPGMPGDTRGTTYKISAYLHDGTYLWTYDMGPGIEPGIWYSPFIVYDFNGDGKAEVAIKTADESYVKNEKGRVCGGNEFLSVLDGMTGKEIARADWPERNNRVPGCRNWVWWDADLLRETFKGDDNRWGAGSSSNGRKQLIWKWQGDVLTTGIEGDILMIADMEGDWREEVITALPGEIRIYHTNIPATDRRTTLMQNPLYRSYVAHRSMGYPQAPVPSYYLGE